jgi:hypothetical protein
MLTVKSINNISIRLTDERWEHILDEHFELNGLLSEILGTVSEPDVIFSGNFGELLAVKEYQAQKYIVVVYKETENDCFIITAYTKRQIVSLNRRLQLWP